MHSDSPVYLVILTTVVLLLHIPSVLKNTGYCCHYCSLVVITLLAVI